MELVLEHKTSQSVLHIETQGDGFIGLLSHWQCNCTDDNVHPRQKDSCGICGCDVAKKGNTDLKTWLFKYDPDSIDLINFDDFKIDSAIFKLHEPDGLVANPADDYEHFKIILTEERNPVSFNNKMLELMSQVGYSESEAREFIASSPIELELYYQVGLGLFALESEAVENINFYSPYDKSLYCQYSELL